MVVDFFRCAVAVSNCVKFWGKFWMGKSTGDFVWIDKEKGFKFVKGEIGKKAWVIDLCFPRFFDIADFFKCRSPFWVCPARETFR